MVHSALPQARLIRPCLHQVSLIQNMLWTSELAEYLEDAPWPANKAELIDYCDRIGAPPAVVKNLEEIEDEEEQFESIVEIWRRKDGLAEYLAPADLDGSAAPFASYDVIDEA